MYTEPNRAEPVRATSTRTIAIPRRVAWRVSRLSIHCQTIPGSPLLTRVPKSDSDRIDASHAPRDPVALLTLCKTFLFLEKTKIDF